MSVESVSISNSLISAVCKGNLEKVRELISSFGLSYSPEWSEGYNLLFAAIEYKHKAIAKLLLTNGSEVNSKNVRPTNTALHLAVINGHIEIIKMLLDRSANMDVLNEFGNNPLHIAVENRNMVILELLLNRGAHVDAKNFDGRTALHMAVIRSSLNTVDLLLKYRANINSESSEGDTPLHLAAQHCRVKISKLLLSEGANVNAAGKEGRTPLHIATEKKNVQMVDIFLKYGAYVNSALNSTCKEGYTSLHLATESKCIKIIKLLLSVGANVNAAGIDGKTPLHIAAEKKNVDDFLVYGRYVNFAYNSTYNKSYTSLQAAEHECIKIIKLFLNKGANVDAKEKHGKTPLHIAVARGHKQLVLLFLQHGANANAMCAMTGKAACTPLHFAVEEGNEEMVKLLLSNNAFVDTNAENNLTPLYVAVKNRHETIVKLLLEHGANIDTEDKDGKSILRLAVEEGRPMIIDHILKYRPNINNQSNKSSLYAAVHWHGKETSWVANCLFQYGIPVNKEDVNNHKLMEVAIEKGCLKIVEDLLMYGADVNRDVMYHKGFTLLHSATKNKQEAVASLLINYGANVNAEDGTGKTPLFYANVKITNLLLTNGAKVNVKQNDGTTALHVATRYGNKEVVELLLKSDAEVNSKLKARDNVFTFTEQNDGTTALHIACKNGNKEVVEVLLKYGATIDSKSEGNITPLHVATQENHVKIVEILLKFGAEIDSINEDGETALHIASKEGHKEIVVVLLGKNADINITNKINQIPLEIAKDIFDSFNEVDYDSDYSGDAPYELYDDYEEIVLILKQQIIKMKTANLYVNERNLQMIRNDEEIVNFQNKCEEEIQTMKLEKISNSNVCFRDILTKSVVCARNENVVQFLKSYDYETKFPIYSSMLNSQFRKGMERKVLLDQGINFFHSIFNGLPELPYICIAKIFNLLNNKELRILVRSL